jgi:RimJ/RimL family protein N-acetyltransferase/glycosyltransferase involved in cell wall biosynthesis
MYKILIRPLAIEDADISWKWRNDPEVWAQTGNKPDKSITLDIEIDWIKKVIRDEGTKRFAITVDNQYVGNVQLTDINDSEGQFHIFIGEKSFWGKGVASQATYQILNYAKEILKLTEVYLYVKKSNLSAVRVYKKNSFVEQDEQNDEKIKMICKLSDLPLPTVSIFCMVYNHEKYISDAIEGFLMQKNNFNSVIVIGEDCSRDGSRNVINSYVERFPGKFRLIYHDLNVGAHKNQQIVLKNCNGKYVAMCEGDDYWTDHLKLQTQIDYLEANHKYSICFTDYSIYHQNSNSHVYPNLTEKYKNINTFSRKDIVLNNFIPTLTSVFRNKPDTLNFLNKELFPGDWFIHILNSKYGKIKFLPINSAVYRKHEGGVCSSSDPILNNLKYIKSIEIFRKQFKKDYILQLLFFVTKNKIRLESLKFKLKFLLKPE